MQCFPIHSSFCWPTSGKSIRAVCLQAVLWTEQSPFGGLSLRRTRRKCSRIEEKPGKKLLRNGSGTFPYALIPQFQPWRGATQEGGREDARWAPNGTYVPGMCAEPAPRPGANAPVLCNSTTPPSEFALTLPMQDSDSHREKDTACSCCRFNTLLILTLYSLPQNLSFKGLCQFTVL